MQIIYMQFFTCIFLTKFFNEFNLLRSNFVTEIQELINLIGFF